MRQPVVLFLWEHRSRTEEGEEESEGKGGEEVSNQEQAGEEKEEKQR